MASILILLCLSGTITELSMASNVVDEILSNEGGYSGLSHDKGNWTGHQVGVGTLAGTNMGITPTTLAAFRGVSPDSITAKDMKDLKEKEARAIYTKSYISPFDGIKDDRLRENAIDFGVTSGPARSAITLQNIVGAKPDGNIGPNTIRKLNKSKTDTNTFSDARERFYRGLAGSNANHAKSLNGWLNRVDRYRN
jgi:lysozyme family protein